MGIQPIALSLFGSHYFTVWFVWFIFPQTCETTVMTVEMTEATAAKAVLMTMNCDDIETGANGALRFKALTGQC